MGYSYKGSIGFGLVYIPIALTAVTEADPIGFRMLDKKTMSRIKYKKTCEECDGREVPNEDIVKGYEYEDDRYVVFDEKDFERIKTKKDKNIVIDCFVDLDEIDPIYYDRSYYVTPTGAEKAYALLVAALREENKTGIAKTVLGTRETLVALREKNGTLVLNTLFFAEEIRKNPVKAVEEPEDAKELTLAKSIIEGMAEPFRPETYRNEYRQRVCDAIDQKIAGQQISVPRERADRRVVDLMEALQQSLSELGGVVKKPRKTAAKPKKKSAPPKPAPRAAKSK